MIVRCKLKPTPLGGSVLEVGERGSLRAVASVIACGGSCTPWTGQNRVVRFGGCHSFPAVRPASILAAG
jgi:hypothetical protein